MIEFLSNYGIELGAISLGSVSFMLWRIVVFFKKDKYLLPFVNVAKVKAVEIFGKENVTDFLHLAKEVKLTDLKVFANEQIEKFNLVDNKLNIMFKVWIATGMLNDLPELKDEVERIIE